MIQNMPENIEDTMRSYGPYFGWEQHTRMSIASVKKYVRMGYRDINSNLRHTPKGDEIFILGSGPTVNDISENHWKFISSRGSVAFNNFITHPFAPDFYFIQANNSESYASDLRYCYSKQRENYKDVIFIGRGDAVNKFEFHKSPDCIPVMEDAKDRLYFSPELFIHSKSKINPRRILRDLIRRGVLRYGEMASILPKFGATVPMIHIFAALLGYKKIIFCGVDMFDKSHFYDAVYGKDVLTRFERRGSDGQHPHTVGREFSIPRILADQARELYQVWGVETYCTSKKSLLHPRLPKYCFP